MSEFICLWNLPPIANQENIKTFIESFCITKQIIKLNATSALVELDDEDEANDAAVYLDNLDVMDCCVQAAVITENSAVNIRLNINNVEYLKGLRLQGEPFYESENEASQVPDNDQYYEFTADENSDDFHDRINNENTELLGNINLNEEEGSNSSDPDIIDIHTNDGTNSPQNDVVDGPSWYATAHNSFVMPPIMNTSFGADFFSEIDDVYAEYEVVSSVESDSSEEVEGHITCTFPTCRGLPTCKSEHAEVDDNDQVDIFTSGKSPEEKLETTKQKIGFLDGNKCSVCLSSYSEIILNESHLVATPCGHVFCCKCADDMWTRKKPFCPVCRVKLVPFYPLQLNEGLKLEAKVQQLYFN